MPGRNSENRVAVLNPRPGTKPVRISAPRYYDLKGALMRNLQENDQGIAFAELPDVCANSLAAPLWENASLGWYVTSVKLDLEARGLIYRSSRKGRQQVHLAPGPR